MTGLIQSFLNLPLALREDIRYARRLFISGQHGAELSGMTQKITAELQGLGLNPDLYYELRRIELPMEAQEGEKVAS